MLLDNKIPVDFIAQFFDLSTIFILLYVTLKNISKILSETKILVYMIFFMFYVLPLILDYVVGFPEYTAWRVEGFTLSQHDTLTRIVYDFCLLLCTWIILRYRHKDNHHNVNLEFNKKSLKSIKVMLFIGMFLPAFFVLLLNLPIFMLFVPMWREAAILEIPKNYSLVEKLDFVGVCCCILYLFGRLKNVSIITRIISLALLYINICIEGKRGIIFFTLMCVIILWLVNIQIGNVGKREKLKSIFKIAVIGIAVILAMIIISVNVKLGRGYEDSPTVLYTAMRVDFVRDDRVRHAIFELLYPGKLHILDYPGQTIWPIILWFYPTDILFSKVFGVTPLHYSFYLSRSLKGTDIDMDESFMTPALYGELISNFSFLGVIFMALFTIWFIKKADNFPYPINLFVIISFTAWQMYPLGYILLYLEFTLFLCLVYHFKYKIIRKINAEV